ncbi:MAG: hypothetical protein AABW65_00545 [Nanoarchaeota archaeon]
MSQDSTILLNKQVIEKLKEAKEHPRQTYNELLEKILHLYLKLKKQKEVQYDRFLFEIQKKKMKELWDNEYDEVWEKV